MLASSFISSQHCGLTRKHNAELVVGDLELRTACAVFETTPGGGRTSESKGRVSEKSGNLSRASLQVVRPQVHPAFVSRSFSRGVLVKAEDCVEAHGQPTEPFHPNDFSKGTRTDFGVGRDLAALALSAVEHVTRESRPCPVRSGAEQRPAVLHFLEVRHDGRNDEGLDETAAAYVGSAATAEDLVLGRENDLDRQSTGLSGRCSRDLSRDLISVARTKVRGRVNAARGTQHLRQPVVGVTAD